MTARPRRQLNEEETRIYAAGMAARRRGEHAPKEELPFEQYKIWNSGWRRVGRTRGSFTDIMRSDDHRTLVQGMHCIHTEVETFDDALNVLEIRQLKKALSESVKDTPPTWKQELAAHKARKKSPKGHALVVGDQRESEFEQHIIGRVLTAIQSLKLGIDEMSVMSATGTQYPAVNPKALMDIVVRLCHLIKQDAPNFTTQRTTVHPPLQRCVDCGAELEKNEIKYCRHCNPATKSLRIAAQLQREHYAKIGGLAQETKKLSKLIGKLNRKVIDNGDDQGHGGYSGEVVGGVEAGGRKENLVLGGETPHQPGASSTGNTEG